MIGINGGSIFSLLIKFGGIAFCFILQLIVTIPALIFLLILRLRSWWIVRRAKSEGLKFLTGPDAFSGHASDAIITTACGLSGIPDIDSAREVMKQQMMTVRDKDGELLFKKLTQVSVMRSGLLFWKCVEIDMNSHVVLYTGINPSTKEEMLDIICELNAEKIVPAIPCWKVIIVPTKGDLLTTGIQSFLVLRIHHSILDGISLMRMLPHFFCQCAKSTDEQTAAMTFTRIKTNHSICAKMCRRILGTLSIMYTFLRMAVPNRNILHGSTLQRTSYIHQAIFDLPAIKLLKNVSQSKFNDLLISTLTGAIRRYFIYKNAHVPNHLGIIIPVVLTHPCDPIAVENNYSFIFLKTPLHIEDSVHRLKSTTSVITQAKKSPEVFVNFWILKHLIRYLPHSLFENAINGSSSATLVVSSIHGPQVPMKVFEHDVIDLIVPIPHRGITGATISLVGYNNKLYVTIAIDKALLSSKSDVAKITDFFTEELQNLQNRFLT